MNRVVARFQDGRLLKGTTNDFFPNRSHFHILPEEQPSENKPVEVRVADLKALFFVKTFGGNPQRMGLRVPEQTPKGAGRRIRVVFTDGEVLLGTTQGYDRSRPGFFVIPFEPDSNNERCFVVAAATQEVSLL